MIDLDSVCPMIDPVKAFPEKASFTREDLANYMWHARRNGFITGINLARQAVVRCGSDATITEYHVAAIDYLRKTS